MVFLLRVSVNNSKIPLIHKIPPSYLLQVKYIHPHTWAPGSHETANIVSARAGVLSEGSCRKRSAHFMVVRGIHFLLGYWTEGLSF